LASDVDAGERHPYLGGAAAAGGAKPAAWSHIVAFSVMMVLSSMLGFFFAQRYFIQGVVMSGIKG